jgi:hypothetical protein
MTVSKASGMWKRMAGWILWSLSRCGVLETGVRPDTYLEPFPATASGNGRKEKRHMSHRAELRDAMRRLNQLRGVQRLGQLGYGSQVLANEELTFAVKEIYNVLMVLVTTLADDDGVQL